MAALLCSAPRADGRSMDQMNRLSDNSDESSSSDESSNDFVDPIPFDENSQLAQNPEFQQLLNSHTLQQSDGRTQSAGRQRLRGQHRPAAVPSRKPPLRGPGPARIGSADGSSTIMSGSTRRGNSRSPTLVLSADHLIPDYPQGELGHPFQSKGGAVREVMKQRRSGGAGWHRHQQQQELSGWKQRGQARSTQGSSAAIQARHLENQDRAQMSRRS